MRSRSSPTRKKLAQLNLSIETVAKRIRAENVNLSGGRLEQGSQRYSSVR